MLNADPIAIPDGAGLRNYPGAKDGAGVFQSIVNQIPPHDVWIEAFVGSGAVTRHKRAAASSIVIDSDPAVACAWRSAGVTVICGDASSWLEKHRATFTERTVVYCDPPYLFDVRACPGRRYYGHEFGTESLHGELIAVLCRMTTPVLLSGYRSDLYDRTLSNWRRVDYSTSTRGGAVVESLWCNFEEPTALHDYRYLGRNFRERERIKRKLARWRARLEKMPILERRLISAALGPHR